MPTTTVDTQPYENMTVLCVDDERVILRTLQRLFHSKPYNVLTAGSAKEALSIMDTTHIDVIVSDMRMPEMDGASLLAEVARLHPNNYRIVLSGYADFESTVAAINLGKIHKFVNKPWDNASLVESVEEGLNLVHLQTENRNLKEKIAKQNILLKNANNDLEEKINLRTKQIRASLLRNDRNNKDCERMLFNFIGINPNLSSVFARNVAQLAVRIGEELNIDKDGLHDIRLAGYLNEVGLLGLEPLYCQTPYRSLNYDQKTSFMNQGDIAQQILSPAQRLNGVKSILTHQYLPIKDIEEKLSPQEQLPCKIIIIARDYWRFFSGKIDENKISTEQVFIELNKSIGTKYDESILKLLITKPELIDEGHIEGTHEEGVTTLNLLPDMVLKQSLFSSNNLLILAEGHIFTENSIAKLIEYETNKKQHFTLMIENL